MARKKGGGMTKAEAVRQTLAEGIDTPADGVAYVKEKHGLDITPQQFSTYKSIAKKKAGGTPAKRGRRAAAPAAAPTPSAPAGLATSVEAIKVLVEQYGVEQVVSIARLFGK